VDLFRSKLVKLFSPREKRRDGSENVYKAEDDGERLHGGIRRRLTQKMMSSRKKRASKGKDKVGAGDEEGEAQAELSIDGEDSGARGNKDGVVADCATDDGVWGGEGRGMGSMGQ
ncbi:unnamed protein product, partial [Brassica oleracea]